MRVGKFRSLSCVSNMREIRVHGTENSYASVEKGEENEDSAADSVAAAEPKRSAKIHDFCFGIPFGEFVYIRFHFSLSLSRFYLFSYCWRCEGIESEFRLPWPSFCWGFWDLDC